MAGISEPSLDKQHELNAEEGRRIRAFGAVILVGVGAALCFERFAYYSFPRLSSGRLDNSPVPQPSRYPDEQSELLDSIFRVKIGGTSSKS